MIKVLGIVGSPRKGGNTETVKTGLADWEQEGAETELIHTDTISNHAKAVLLTKLVTAS
jgi:multimeric flavodoxin WrbA